MTVNWENAPEGATHYRPHGGFFYKKEDRGLFFWDGACWIESDEPELLTCRNGGLIPRPTPTAIPQTAQEIERLRAENERLKAGHRRYEILRKLNVVQFQALYTKSLQSPIPFDELVDMLGESK